jgi:hypothetical protein
MRTSVPSRPEPTEYGSFYSHYVALVPDVRILAALESQLAEMVPFLRGVTEEEANTRHPPYTWSVKEVVGHFTDSERVFGYRALCFAREDQALLPGFDENNYVQSAGFDACPLRDLVDEFEFLRRSHMCFFRGLSDSAWQRHGSANGSMVTVRALAYIIVGHARHHGDILHKRLKR